MSVRHPRASQGREIETDEALVAEMLEGDPAAWRRFIAGHRARIHAVIARTLGQSSRRFGQHEVEEVYSSLLATLLARDMHKLRAFDPRRGTRLSTWVGVIAMHTAQDHLRAALRERSRRVAIEDDLVLADGRDDPYEQLARQHDLRSVHAAMQALSTRDRQLLELMFVLDQTPEQVANTMQLSLSTIYSKKHKLAALIRRRRQGAIPRLAAR